MYIAVSMAGGWPAYQKRAAREYGLFVEKLTTPAGDSHCQKQPFKLLKKRYRDRQE